MELNGSELNSIENGVSCFGASPSCEGLFSEGFFLSSGVLSDGAKQGLNGLPKESWRAILNCVPPQYLLSNEKVWHHVSAARERIKRELHREVVDKNILNQIDVWGVFFHPFVFDILSSSPSALQYRLNFTTFRVLILCYLSTTRESGDKYISTKELVDKGFMPGQTCRDQFAKLEKAELIARAKYLDVHATRGTFAQRAQVYYYITSKGKEMVKDFYKEYVKKLRDFQELFGKVESNFSFKK